jgi:hypothetical protein
MLHTHSPRRSNSAGTGPAEVLLLLLLLQLPWCQVLLSATTHSVEDVHDAASCLDVGCGHWHWVVRPTVHLGLAPAAQKQHALEFSSTIEDVA